MAETITAAEGQVGADALARPGGASAPAVHTASLFRGRGEYAIDDKGRLTLPAQMRKALQGGGSLVVLEGRAVIWDEPTYRRAVDELNARVAEGDLTTTQVRAFLSNTHTVSPDTQGRIVIPHAVRIEADLTGDVVVLGSGARIEIVPARDTSLLAVRQVDADVIDVLDRGQF